MLSLLWPGMIGASWATAVFAALALLLAVANSAAPTKKKPNFVYVLCDDMNELLGDEQVVKQTRKLIADAGARAANAFVSSPKCTPSRSAWLSGRYYHNLRPGQSEGAPASGRGLNTTHFFDVDAVFPTLHRNGYQTALFGKIHNNQAEWLCHPQNHTEPFTHIETECSPCGNYFPKAFVVKSSDAVYTSMETLGDDNVGPQKNCSVPLKPCSGANSVLKYCPSNPDPHQCSNQESSHYSHAQYGNRSVAFIKQAAKSSKPFFVFVGTTGPHLPAEPAPWHQAIANSLNISAPRTPNFNMLASDHFDLLSTHPILTPNLVGDIDNLMKQRWGTLLSIDDLVAGLHQAVEDVGMLDNTYFLYSSDHVSSRLHVLVLLRLLPRPIAESAGAGCRDTIWDSFASRLRKCCHMRQISGYRFSSLDQASRLARP